MAGKKCFYSTGGKILEETSTKKKTGIPKTENLSLLFRQQSADRIQGLRNPQAFCHRARENYPQENIRLLCKASTGTDKSHKTGAFNCHHTVYRYFGLSAFKFKSKTRD